MLLELAIKASDIMNHFVPQEIYTGLLPQQTFGSKQSYES